LPPALLKFFTINAGQAIDGPPRRAKRHDLDRAIGKARGLSSAGCGGQGAQSTKKRSA
jgi:hypothetical protein